MIRRLGFTLLELIITMTIIAVLATAAWPQLNGYFVQAEKQNDLWTTVSLLRQAQEQSRAGYLDKSWGVKIYPEKAVIFAGDSYAGRLIGSEREITYHKTRLEPQLTAGDEIIFLENTGRPISYGQVKISFADSSQMKIKVSANGLIEY